MAAIAESFRKLLVRTAPPEKLALEADQRIAAIRLKLLDVFKGVTMLKVGSLSRETFIQGSDVDAFAVLKREDVRWGDGYMAPATVLNHVRDALQTRYRNTPVYRDGHSVVVDFHSCKVDVVPAFFWKWKTAGTGAPLYAMPHPNGEWMLTSPKLHNRYLQLKHLTSGGKLRRVARLLKYWRACRTPQVPLSSFHIEMLLASEGTCDGRKTYAECVADALILLANRGCRSLRDPEGVSGLIPATGTECQRISALASVANSADHAARACDAEVDGNLVEARRQWDVVFRGDFPQ